jgi:5-(carboxyamino)imidazole ribonucleotide synthase
MPSNQSALTNQLVQPRVGVIGGGQLAGMMAGAAKALGVKLIVQTANPTDPAVAIASQSIIAGLDDLPATKQLATQVDVITFENEFIDLTALAPLAAAGVCFRPSLKTLQPLLDKYEQRTYLQAIGLPVPQFAALAAGQNPLELGFGWPVVIKSRRHGYDGQGTFVIRDAAALTAFWQQVKLPASEPDQAFLVEKFIPYQQELAIIAARSVTGEIVTYPIVETQQEQQVCRRVIVPAAISDAIATQIAAIAQRLLTELAAIGVFGIELFQTADGKLLINEIAPRTHNSGHFSLDACPTSQFEQHLRAICGLPLGDCTLKSAGAVMFNLLGFEQAESSYLEQRHQLAKLPQTFVHWYGKTQSYPGRKLGHVTTLLNTSDRQAALNAAQAIEAIWYGDRSKN